MVACAAAGLIKSHLSANFAMSMGTLSETVQKRHQKNPKKQKSKNNDKHKKRRRQKALHPTKKGKPQARPPLQIQSQRLQRLKLHLPWRQATLPQITQVIGIQCLNPFKKSRK